MTGSALSRARSHLASRGRLLLAAAGLAGAFVVMRPSPPRTVEGVASMLGDAVGGHVAPSDFVWEARGSALHDAFVGRSILFLASKDEGPRDLFRARVRVARSGQPIEVVSTRDLSQTKIGDERDLIARGHHAAIATVAYGAVQAVTLIDLQGRPAKDGSSIADRLRNAASGWLEAGSAAPIARTEITASKPLESARFELTNEALILALGEPAAPASVGLDGAANLGPGDPFGLSVEPRRPRDLADRAIVAGAIARLASPSASRAAMRTYDAIIEGVAKLRARREAAAAIGARKALAAPEAPPPADDDAWPPHVLAPRFDPPLEGEGVWRSLVLPPREGRPEGAPSPLVVTRVRPFADDPSAIVHLVAMDMRQLDLRLQAGRDAPHPAVGAHGLGRIEAARAGKEESVVAAFNGASSARGERLGMIARDRILVPPTSGAPSIAIERRGRAAFGPWPLKTPSGQALPALFVEGFGTVRSLVQTEAPLLDEGQLRVRAMAPGKTPDRPTARSALCLTGASQLVYAYAARASEDALSAALVMVGCSYALPLAAAPDAVGFVMRGACAKAPDSFTNAAVDAAMTLTPEEVCEGASSDFFYVVENDSAPPFPPAGEARWEPAAGRQPEPAWRPAIHEAEVDKLGARVVLTTLSAKRFSWQIRAGEREPSRRGDPALPRAIAAEDMPQVIAALGLGLSRRRPARGLTIDGISGKPFRSAGGALVLDPSKQRLSVALLPNPVVPEAGSAVELPLAADEGKLLSAAREIGRRRSRGALCVHEDGTVVIASATFDSDEATTEALLDLGCTRVVALDRGSGRSHTFRLAGTGDPPLQSDEVTTLFALERPMRGRAERFDP